MIDKTNWRLVKKFLAYRESVDLLSKGSMKIQDIQTRYLLEWAQDVPFRQAPTIRPSFPQYLLTSRLDGGEGRLSAGYIKKTLVTARLFFTWLSDNETGFKNIKHAWIKTLKIKHLSDTPKNKGYVTFQDILTIAARPARSVWERRTRAAMVFLYLSCMRISAFVSLPIKAVDISNLCVLQYPELGVRTKNSKAAKTFLLSIPELLQVVQEWDDEVRAALPDSGYWFAPFSPHTGLIDHRVSEVGAHRDSKARQDFRAWLKQENLPYYSPHKFRHGHVHYGLEHSENIADFKAVSLNAMHSNMEITDTFYSVLRDDEVKNRIRKLSEKSKPHEQEDVIKILENLVSTMKKGL